MRPSNKSRSRNKSGGNGNHNQRRGSMGNIVNRVFESAGPDGKVRGTPQQIIDKYQALARDAQVSGDRVAAESYLQHSEHYSRLLGEAQRQQMETRYQDREDGQGPRDDGFGGEQRRQPQQPAMAGAPSGLAMIEPEDTFDGGPVETPEGRRAPVAAPPAPVVPMQPAPAPQPAPNGGGRAERAPAPQPAEAEAAASEPQAAEAAEAPQPPKRARSRTRRPKAEAPAPSQDEEGAAQAS
jgi:hypothetical protein